MSKTNRERVGELLDLLNFSLGPFVLREYKMVYRKDYLTVLKNTLEREVMHLSAEAFESEAGALQNLDVQAWLKAMMFSWREVFNAKLGQTERNYASELMGTRNDWAHQKAFNNDDAQRAADTASRLLESIGATKEAAQARASMNELRRLSYEAEMRQSQKTPPAPEESPRNTPAGLKPWRLVVQPHPDVASGRYVQAEFAADLAQVVQGKADPEYNDPQEFFRRTYLTTGLLELLITGCKRLSGQGGDPVVQLQTSFGGGKTHSMLALYHLFGGRIRFDQIPGGELILQQVENIDQQLQANRAVIVGTAFSPTQPRRYADCTTHTLWGDIAYQLGGLPAYEMLQAADLSGVNPGSDTLLQILEAFGPALIIIDELVAFARNLYNVPDRLPAGSFDGVMSFVQSLTEAVKRSSDSMLLVSIPESDIEIGGEGGRASLEILAKTIGRLESVWKPVTATESFEIVRRRLFSSEIDYAARDAVLRAFQDMYAQNGGDFPTGVAESDYKARMQAAYPIHPELFDRLYQEWSTLDRFQRTRGVLRLMAAVIHRLWQDHDQALLIMPGSLPLFSATVRNEMLRYLPENWPAILDADVDGQESKPYQLDKSVPTLGQYMASRRVARSIFVGSAPSVAAQQVRGIEEVRIRLATVQPGEQAAIFNDALRRMSNQLAYLYSDGSRHWYDTRPTVNRMAQDRAQNIPADLVEQEAIGRLRAIRFRREDFNAVHVAPQGHGDVADEWRFRAVVLGPWLTHKKSVTSSEAQKAAKEFLENRGNAPRLYRNMLIFIVADEVNAAAWAQSVREYLAWQSIHEEAEPLNLDAQQRKQVSLNLKRNEETLVLRLQETYCWLIVPVQPDPLGPIDYQAQRIPGEDSFYERAARKLRQNEFIIPRWSPDNLRMELERFLWRGENQVGIKQLWEYLARYCYLPRLYDEKVLLAAIQEGVSRPESVFAYAAGQNQDGTYRGLSMGEPASIYFDDTSMIVRAEVALQQLEAMWNAGTSNRMPPQPAAKLNRTTPEMAAPPPPKVRSRYHGSVELDPQRANREMGTIVEEIIQRLSSLGGVHLEINLEISASRPEGFDEATIRTISENSRTLKFNNHGFD
jgi:predicted AAA+ superfamily ATPase